MQSRTLINTSWVRWKNSVKIAVTLDTEDVKGAQNIGGNTGGNYIRCYLTAW